MDEKKLKEYLGVAPADFSHAPEFGLYNWAKRESLRKQGVIDEKVTDPPQQFYDGRKITQDDITNYLQLSTKEINQIIGEENDQKES